MDPAPRFGSGSCLTTPSFQRGNLEWTGLCSWRAQGEGKTGFRFWKKEIKFDVFVVVAALCVSVPGG